MLDTFMKELPFTERKALPYEAMKARELEDARARLANPPRPAVRAALEGALAGAAATAVMSGVLLAARSGGLLGEPPPRAIVRLTLRRAGARPDGDALDLLALGAHLGFGASAGALYGALGARRSDLVGPTTGVLHGLAVWAASYAGWIPAARLLPAPSRDPRPGRQGTMLLAHVVFGAALGLFARALRARP